MLHTTSWTHRAPWRHGQTTSITISTPTHRCRALCATPSPRCAFPGRGQGRSSPPSSQNRRAEQGLWGKGSPLKNSEPLKNFLAFSRHLSSSAAIGKDQRARACQKMTCAAPAQKSTDQQTSTANSRDRQQNSREQLDRRLAILLISIPTSAILSDQTPSLVDQTPSLVRK